jgi:hypothetical protein
MVSKESLRKKSKDELVDMCYDLSIIVDQLSQQLQELQREVDQLKRKKPKNSSNSSLPPSKDMFRLKNQSLRK